MIKRLLEYNFPEDLKNMTVEELSLLAYEVREFLLENVSRTGGHLAANLGVVELTIALHKFYESPRDKIIFDVGHQTYVHKILTGRGDKFPTLRKLEGLSGFPKCYESPHDVYETGHAGTSVSAAFGYAKARDLKGENHKVIALVGDGALTCGLSYEGLNMAGGSGTDITVILNDNEMSISGNVGAVSSHLSKLRTSRKYLNLKEKIKRNVVKIPAVGEGLYQGMENIKDSIKYAVIENAALFEALGFQYIGPIDGHNISDLLEAFKASEDIKGPKIIHVLTKKGKGYVNAEQNPNKFHGIPPFEIETGKVINNSKGISYSDLAGSHLKNMADKDERIVAVYAAMLEGTGLEKFKPYHEERCFDVGIAEGGAVTFAAGLAKGGLKPFVAIYSTFLQRSYDMIIMDVALQNLPVVFLIDRAGIVGNDGETHHGVFDLSYLSSIPNMTIMCPRNGNELVDMMDAALTFDSPVAIRYPRGDAYYPKEKEQGMTLEPYEVSFGNDGCVFGVGPMFYTAKKAAERLAGEGIMVTVIDPKTINYNEYSFELSLNFNKVITVEDNVIRGGFGEKLSAFVSNHGLKDMKVLNLGWPSCFIPQGSQSQLYKLHGLDEEGVYERIKDFVKG